MDGNPVEEPETSPWANFVKQLRPKLKWRD